MRRYFVSFMNEFEGKLRHSSRELNWVGDFVFKEVQEFLDKENNCKNSTIVFFKELEKYEYYTTREQDAPVPSQTKGTDRGTDKEQIEKEIFKDYVNLSNIPTEKVDIKFAKEKERKDV